MVAAGPWFYALPMSTIGSPSPGARAGGDLTLDAAQAPHETDANLTVKMAVRLVTYGALNSDGIPLDPRR